MNDDRATTTAVEPMRMVTYPETFPKGVSRAEFRPVGDNGEPGLPVPVRVASDGTHARVGLRCPHCSTMPMLVQGTKYDLQNNVAATPAKCLSCTKIVGVLVSYLEQRKNRAQRRAAKNKR